ncbi:competence protein ComEC [Agaricicola taiwanensis]|uniref:Competence protein ComEC n=1 Tax=Agaricicola taiwanensis TaxID=591372 RepID=A0A8J2YI49_9RHOB|nr:ComEC/Rec2 family competence protein [Agaricicola taiwanensis]GGE44435.1 competence protein ComEC [Agaricicola taiwanensis]
MRPWPRFADLLAEEREWGRLFLWLPVLFGCGVLLFFGAGQNPNGFLSATLSGMLAAAAFLARRREFSGPVLIGAALIAFGFTSAAIRTENVKAPILERPARATVTGLVEHVEPRARGYRILIAVERFDSRARVSAPVKLRAIVSRKGSEPPVGARIAVDGLWRPPPGAVRPGGYDWSRDAFFLRIGAVGLTEGPPRIVDRAAALPLGLAFDKAVTETRGAIAERIKAAVSGAAGAIAVSLVVGERGAIPESINEDMRVAGLSHVLSISGLHMALFAGAVFWALRLSLVLWTPIPLRHPIKKWAAVAAIFAAYGYLLLAGAEIAAQRSFLMAAIAFLAIVLDRAAISLRSVALAALALMILMPEVLLSISFQMSFAAVLALVALYDHWKHRHHQREERRERSGVTRYLVLALATTAVTTLVAGLATAPFGAFYFQRSGIYSLLANLAALPIVSILIMPFAVIGLALTPFRLDAPAWQIMGWGVDGMIKVADVVAGLPGAAVHTSAFGSIPFLLMIAALIWLCLWRTLLRWLAALPLVAAFVALTFSTKPDIYIEPEGRAMAVRHPDGDLRITGIRFARFAGESWLAADGDARKISDRHITSDVSCDRTACRLTLPDGRAAVLAWTYQALKTDCARADLIVTRLVAPPECRAMTTVIDARDLASRGAIALTLDDGKFLLRSAREPHEERYWFNRPRVRSPLFVEPQEDDTRVEGGSQDPYDGIAQ